MNFKWIMCIACLTCLMLASTLSAQEEIPIDTGGKVIRLAAPNVPAEFNITTWLQTGDFGVAYPVDNMRKAAPGPAPAPYPVAKVWDKGIEQLGVSAVTCDGMCFVNGPLWVPGKNALVLWTIRVPNPSRRLATEFDRDLTLQLWVDWNENRAFDKGERMIVQSFNIGNLFPTMAPFIEIQYLTTFTVGHLPQYVRTGGTSKYETKLWVRTAVSYDDNDASPAGQALFGEYEDWLLNFQENQSAIKTKG